MEIQGINVCFVADVKDSETIPNILFNDIQEAVNASSESGLVVSFKDRESYTARDNVTTIFLKELVTVTAESLSALEVIGRINTTAGGIFLGGVKVPRYFIFDFYQGVGGSPNATLIESTIDDFGETLTITEADTGLYSIDVPPILFDSTANIFISPVPVIDAVSNEQKGTVCLNIPYGLSAFAPVFTVLDATGVPSDSVIGAGDAVRIKVELLNEIS